MEKQMENDMENLGPFKRIYGSQMKKQIENEMETLGPSKGTYREITPAMGNQMDNEVDMMFWEVSPHLREVLRIQNLSYALAARSAQGPGLHPHVACGSSSRRQRGRGVLEGALPKREMPPRIPPFPCWESCPSFISLVKGLHELPLEGLITFGYGHPK